MEHNIRCGIKENIRVLIEKGDIEYAKLLLEDYMKIEKDDKEIYSILSIIYIMDGDLNAAEKILKDSLRLDPKNYDLMFNLAYVYELGEKHLQSLVLYRKALKENYYGIDKSEIESRIKNIKLTIRESRIDDITLNASKIEKILFIDFENSEEVNKIAGIINGYGICVDKAYCGKSPNRTMHGKENPYRKILRITNIDDLIEYAKYYSYDAIHTFSVPHEIKEYLKMKSLQIVDEDISDINGDSLISFYASNKIKGCTKHEMIKNSNITIIIPTYNRPFYLKRVLGFINSYKFISPKVMVLDSSKSNELKNNEKSISEFKGSMDIEYRTYSSDINFYRKLNDGLSSVATDYVALCADDDFLTEEGLIESIRTLEREGELCSVKGKNLYFRESVVNLTEYDWFEGLTEETYMERLKKVTQGFVATLIYQVFRMDNLKKMYLFIEENMDSLPVNYTFKEYLFYFMVIATGKVGKLNVDLNIRDKGVQREIEFPNFPHAVIDGSFNEDYGKFCDFIKKYIIFMGKDVRGFDEDIRMVFTEFLANFLGVPRANIKMENDKFVIEELELGMRHSWCWPMNL